MSNFEIQVRTVGTVHDIDLHALGQYFERPFDIIMNLDGPALVWGLNPRAASLTPETREWLQDGVAAKLLAGVHAETDRTGSPGVHLTNRFGAEVRAISDVPACFAEYPRTGRERRPSGIMSQRIVEKIKSDMLGGHSPQAIGNIALAFIGDNPKHIHEAEALRRTTNAWVVGLLVENLDVIDLRQGSIFSARRDEPNYLKVLQQADQRFVKSDN